MLIDEWFVKWANSKGLNLEKEQGPNAASYYVYRDPVTQTAYEAFTRGYAKAQIWWAAMYVRAMGIVRNMGSGRNLRTVWKST